MTFKLAVFLSFNVLAETIVRRKYSDCKFYLSLLKKRKAQKSSKKYLTGYRLVKL